MERFKKVRHLVNALQRSFWLLGEWVSKSLDRNPEDRLRAFCTVSGEKRTGDLDENVVVVGIRGWIRIL